MGARGHGGEGSGKVPGGADSFIAAFEWFLERESHYSIFPLVKYRDLVAVGQAEPFSLWKAKKAVMLARAGGAYTGYLSGSEAFFGAVEYLRPRLRLYRFLETDAFYADFVRNVLLPLARFNVPREPKLMDVRRLFCKGIFLFGLGSTQGHHPPH